MAQANLMYPFAEVHGTLRQDDKTLILVNPDKVTYGKQE